jgi:hypothetical protein
MSDYTTTPNLQLYKPTPNADGDMWGAHLNTNADTLDALLGTSTPGPFLPISGGSMQGALNYAATGGTIVRSAQNRAAEHADVEDYGAKGDGTGDDGPAINAALTAARPSVGGCGSVFLTPGIYQISTPISIPASNMSLWAIPGTVTLKAAATAAGNPVLLSVNTRSHVTIYGIIFDGNIAGIGNTNKNNVITVFQCSHVKFDACGWQNTRGIACIFSTANTHSGVINSWAASTGTYWRTQTAAFTGSVSGTVLTVTAMTSGTIGLNNGFGPVAGLLPGTYISSFGTGTGGVGTYNVNQVGTVAAATPMTTVYGNANSSDGYAQCFAWTGGAAANSYGNYVQNCVFDDASFDNISIGNQHTFLASGNKFTGKGVATYPAGRGSAIYGTSSDYVTICNNVVQQMYGNGIDIHLCVSVSLTGNDCQFNSAAGIQFAIISGSAMVTGNTCNNNWQGGISFHNAGIAIGGEAGDPATAMAVISGNVCTDTQATKTQQYGIMKRPNAAVTTLLLDQSNLISGNAVADLSGTNYTRRASVLLGFLATSVGNGADTTEDTLQTLTIPALTLMVPGDRLRICANGVFTGSTDVKNARVKIGSTNLLIMTAQTSTQTNWYCDVELIKTGPNTQFIRGAGQVNNVASAVVAASGSFIDTGALTLTVTGQNNTTATANTITCRWLTTDFLPANM